VASIIKHAGAVAAVVSAISCCASLAVLAAPTASADNDSYLAAMDALGATSAKGDDGLLRTGKSACSMLAPSAGLMFGRNPNWVAQVIWEQNPRLERNGAALLVNAAIDNLCPGVNPLGYATVDGPGDQPPPATP
jgi:hypothetical protein